MQIAAAREALEELLNPWVKRPEVIREALIPDAQELFVVLVDDVSELVRGAAGGEGDQGGSPNPRGEYRLGGGHLRAVDSLEGRERARLGGEAGP
jgi:hypothetical protein